MNKNDLIGRHINSIGAPDLLKLAKCNLIVCDKCEKVCSLDDVIDLTTQNESIAYDLLIAGFNFLCKKCWGE